METATVPLRVEFANQPSAKRQPAKAKLERRRSEKSDRLSLFLPPGRRADRRRGSDVAFARLGRARRVDQGAAIGRQVARWADAKCARSMPFRGGRRPFRRRQDRS